VSCKYLLRKPRKYALEGETCDTLDDVWSPKHIRNEKNQNDVNMS
jgi:hypothetical protein